MFVLDVCGFPNRLLYHYLGSQLTMFGEGCIPDQVYQGKYPDAPEYPAADVRNPSFFIGNGHDFPVKECKRNIICNKHQEKYSYIYIHIYIYIYTLGTLGSPMENTWGGVGIITNVSLVIYAT